MTVALTALPCPDSPLRRLDPRWKLAGLVCLTTVTAFLRRPESAALAFATAAALAAFGRLPPRWFLGRLGVAAIFLAPFVISLPVLVRRPDSDFPVGFTTISYGLGVAVLLTLKTLTVVAVMLVLLATSPLDALLKAARSLLIPGILVHLGLLTYRYLFVLSSELRRLRTAMQVRGYRSRSARNRYRTIGHLAGTLLVRGVERAERVGQAMRCRGFDGRFRSLTPFHTRMSDVTAFLALTGIAAGLLIWDFRMP